MEDMKIRFVFVWLFWACCFSAFSQIEENDFKQVPVNRKVKEYSLEIDLSTPLSSYLSREYIMVSGKERLWHEISTYAFDYLFDNQISRQQTNISTALTAKTDFMVQRYDKTNRPQRTFFSLYGLPKS